MSFSEIRKFLIKMQSDEDLKKQVTTSSTADDVALIGQRLGYDFSGDDLLRFNVQILPEVHLQIAPALIILGIINIIYGALNAFAQDNV